MDKKADPVIADLLKWLKENLPPDVDDDAIIKNVRRVQKVFDTLVGLAFSEFYNHAISLHMQERQIRQQDEPTKDDCRPTENLTLEESTSDTLKEAVDYVALNSDQRMKMKKHNASRAKLDLKKEQYQLITSIRLDGCMDLISRYNHLISKK